MSKLRFTCPACDGNALEEVMEGVTVTSQISDIHYDEEDGLEYREQLNEGGRVVRYQCADCGEHIALDHAELMQLDCLEAIS